jgi:23S rRNA (pseudouridine1915-N3)-methyltransferase
VVAGGECYTHAMRWQLITVGKPRHNGLAAAGTDYLSRLRHYIRLEEAVVREERGGKGVSASEIMQREGERILAHVKPGCNLVVLDRKGKTLTSESLAERLQQIAESASDTAFVIGGAWGLSPEVLKRSDWIWTLSTLTYPHELARVMVLEQLYRAQTILRGEPYHK